MTIEGHRIYALSFTTSPLLGKDGLPLFPVALVGPREERT